MLQVEGTARPEVWRAGCGAGLSSPGRADSRLPRAQSGEHGCAVAASRRGGILTENLATPSRCDPSRPGMPALSLRERGQAGALGVAPARTPRAPSREWDRF